MVLVHSLTIRVLWLESLKPLCYTKNRMIRVWKGMEAVKYRRLGEVLLELGMIEEDLLKHALKLQKMSGERLGVILVRQGMLTEQQLLQADRKSVV